jgi:hypothetical protein
MSQNDDVLRVLAVFHFVLAGMATMVSLFPLVHLIVGIGLVSGVFTNPGDPFPFALVGWIFVIFASCWILCGLLFAALMAVAGRMLLNRRRYFFCLAMAGLACMFMPFGTILGAFTIVTLMKADVREQFQPSPC